MIDVATGAGADPLGAAEQALVVVLSDPTRGEHLATQALDIARRARNPAAASVAERAIGIAARNQDELGTANGTCAGAPDRVPAPPRAGRPGALSRRWPACSSSRGRRPSRSTRPTGRPACSPATTSPCSGATRPPC